MTFRKLENAAVDYFQVFSKSLSINWYQKHLEIKNPYTQELSTYK